MGDSMTRGSDMRSISTAADDATLTMMKDCSRVGSAKAHDAVPA